MAELARQEKQRVQSSHEALNAARRFENFNQQVVDDVAIQQQRLEAANLSTNSRLAAKASEILGRQELENERLRIQQEDQVRRMRNSQEIIRNQLQQQFSAQEAKSLSDFGNQLLNFSETLYKQKAEEINEANQRLQAQGQLDGMLDHFGQENSVLDQAQNSRVVTGMRLDNEARELDQQGKPNDATNLRAHNGFYAYGVQEGIAIKNSLELKGYLQQAKEDAIEAKIINFGDPNFDQKLQVYIQQKTIDFMVERGLTNLPPEIQNKYLARTLITSQLEVSAEANEANQKFTLDASVGLARNQIRTAAKSSEFATDLPKMLNQLFAKDPSGFSQNLGKVFVDLKADALESNSMQALDTLITTIKADEGLTSAGQDVISKYLEFEEEFDNRSTKAANATAKENAENIKARFLLTINSGQITNASDLAGIREKFIQQARALPLVQSAALIDFITDTDVADLTVVKNANEAFFADGPSPQEARARVDQYPGMPEEAKQKLIQYADRLEKALSDNPDYKSILDASLAQIELTRPELTQNQLQKHPHIRSQIETAIDRRQEKLKQRFYAWASNGDGDKKGKDFQEWLALPAQKDLLENPIVVTTARLGRGTRTMSIPELKVDLGGYEQGVQFIEGDEFPTGLVKTEIDYTDGKTAVFFTTPDLRARARSGKFGLLDSERGVFLTRPEVMEMGAAYEATGDVDPLLRDLAFQANVTPHRFLNDQGSLLGMQGRIEKPKQIVVPVDQATGFVSRNAAETFAQNKGLSRRGAIWFAHVMMSESAGNPRQSHDQGTGHGLFAHRLSRRDDLEAFAKQPGKDINDPVTQMEFALYELEEKYPEIWNVITSANPSTPQLQAAQYNWMRYASEHKAYRAQTLKEQLNRN